MKIQNPFRGVPNTRCRCKTPKGEFVSVASNAVELEIPDDSIEVLIEAIKSGKSDGEAWSSRMWCPERGVMDVQDYLQKMQIEEEKKQLKEKRELEKRKLRYKNKMSYQDE
jgi:hypothetical protein